MIKKKIELPLGSKLKEVKDDILVFEFEEIESKPKFKEGDFVKYKNGFIRIIIPVGNNDNYTITEQVINEDPDGLLLATKEEFEAQVKEHGLKFNYETLQTEPLQKFPNGTWVKWTGAYPTIGRIVQLNDHDGREDYVLEHTNDPLRKYNSCFVDFLEIADITSVLRHLKFLNKMLDTDGEVIQLDEFAHLPQKIEDLRNRSLERFYGKIPIPEKYQKAYEVQPKLLQLYEAWKDEVDFKFSDTAKNKWCINLVNNNLVVSASIDRNYLFAFKTQKKAERFLSQFRELLEDYKPLMGVINN